MALRTITSQNSQFLLMIPGVFNAPQAIQGYAADDMFTTDQRQLAEVVMGVDGHQSAGLVNHATPMKIKLSPDSSSIFVFDAWIDGQETAGDVIFAQAVVTLSSTGAKYQLSNGVLMKGKQMPDAKKVLQAQDYEISWENITKARM